MFYLILEKPKIVFTEIKITEMHAVESMTFLKLTLDNKLSWDLYIFNLKFKVSFVFFILSRLLRPMFSDSPLLAILFIQYNFLNEYPIRTIESHISYHKNFDTTAYICSING